MILAVVAVLSLGAPAPGVPAAGPRAPQLPNLVPLPPLDIEIGAPDSRPTGPPVGALRFGVAVANRGDHHLDLFGRPQDPLGQVSAAEQCVEWASDRMCSARKEVGRFIWHPEHGHHHFEDFALYELRRFRGRGRPDMRPRGLVAGGTKVSFCLMDIEREDDGATFPQGSPVYLSCAAGTGFQGISKGWMDIYAPSQEGQQIELSDVKDGRYALVVKTDPDGRLLESTDRDNIAVTGIELSDGATKVEIFCVSDAGRTRCRRAAVLNR